MNDENKKLEKEAIESCKPAGMTLLNNPPSEPSHVETEQYLVAERCEMPKDSPNLSKELHMDIRLTTACEHDADTLTDLSGAVMDGKYTKFPLDIDLEGDEWDAIVILSYPLTGKHAFSVKVGTSIVSVGDIVWAICQAYRAAYADPKHYGIWGHDIGDLFIEGCEVDPEAGIIDPTMGS